MNSDTDFDQRRLDQFASLPSPETQEMLDCLRAVAAAEIERKRRLGQYVVVWLNGRPALIGEDAPLEK